MAGTTAQQYREQFGARVRACRLAYHWELAELAARIGKSPSTVSRIETGKINVSLNVVHRIASAFAIRPSVLLDTEADEASQAREALLQTYLATAHALRCTPK